MFAHQLTVDAVITFLIELALAGCVLYAIYWFLGKINLDQGIKNIILFLIAIVAVAWLLHAIGLWSGGTV